MTAPINPLRRGSAGYEAIEAVRRHGSMTGTAIAVEIEKPVDEIAGLLGFPVREGLLRIDADGLYHLGDGTKLKPPPPAAPPVAAPAPPAPEPAPEPATLVAKGEAHARARNNAAQKRELERAIIERQAPAASVGPVAATVAAAPESAHPVTLKMVADQVGSVVQQIPGTPQGPGIDMDAVHRTRHVERPPFVAAYCSDGTYVIEQGGNRIELTMAETLVLFEHMAQIARVAA